MMGMHKWGAALLASLGLASARAPAAEAPADVVLMHGRIHTEDAHRTVVAALAIRGRDIVGAGTDASVQAFVGPKTRVVDLAGATVMPGIIDAHVHPAESAQDMHKCSLGDKEMTPALVKTLVAKCLADQPGDPGDWFEVVMVNPSRLTLTLADLDAILPKRPLLMTGSDGHTTWANSAVLKLAHIDKSTQDPVGGHIERDAAGNPVGTQRDNANSIIYAMEPKPRIEAQAARLDEAFAQMKAIGITSVQDAAANDDMMKLYRRLYDAHKLDMRVRACYHIQNLHDPVDAILARAKKFRETWSVDPEYLRADCVKIFADGVIEYPSQTAALIDPYLDESGKPTQNRGPSYFEQEHLDRIVTAADAAGFTVHIHAIGDRAVRSSLDAFAAARRQNGSLDNRDQIAHLELIEPEDFPRFKQLDAIANFQLQWSMGDAYVRNATIKYIGAERSKHLYPAGSLKRAGAVIAGGSDWGVSTFDAFEAMQHGITRAEGKGQPVLLPDEALTLQDIVDAYTRNAAFALKQEKITGSLEAGKRADLIVLDRDIFAIDPFTLKDTQVKATYVDGREVYRAH